MITTPCVICGGRQFAEVCTSSEVAAHLQYLRDFHQRRLDYRAQEEFADRATFTQDYLTNIVACQYCRLVLRTPRPSTGAITAAYQNDHYGPDRLNALFDAQLRLYRAKAQTLQSWLPQERNVRVLEIGSFVGGFIAAGQEHDWEMLGIDPGTEVSAFCREKGLPVFCGTTQDVGVKPQSVDCVTIWNTFDQLPDPRVTITDVSQLLRPGGILVVRVPNGECFRWAVLRLRSLSWPWAGWLRSILAWNNLLAFPYLYGYSVSTLDRLLRGYGFRRVDMHPDTLMPLADHHTKSWAKTEERFLKYLCSLATRMETLRPAEDVHTAPWLDVYYRLVCASETTSLPVMHYSPSTLMPHWQVASLALGQMQCDRHIS